MFLLLLLLSSLKVPDLKFCIMMREPTGGTAGGLMLIVLQLLELHEV